MVAVSAMLPIPEEEIRFSPVNSSLKKDSGKSQRLGKQGVSTASSSPCECYTVHSHYSRISHLSSLHFLKKE